MNALKEQKPTPTPSPNNISALLKKAQDQIGALEEELRKKQAEIAAANEKIREYESRLPPLLKKAIALTLGVEAALEAHARIMELQQKETEDRHRMEIDDLKKQLGDRPSGSNGKTFNNKERKNLEAIIEKLEKDIDEGRETNKKLLDQIHASQQLTLKIQRELEATRSQAKNALETAALAPEQMQVLNRERAKFEAKFRDV